MIDSNMDQTRGGERLKTPEEIARGIMYDMAFLAPLSDENSAYLVRWIAKAIEAERVEALEKIIGLKTEILAASIALEALKKVWVNVVKSLIWKWEP